MKMSRKKLAVAAAALIVVAGVLVQAIWRPFGRVSTPPHREIALDIHHPDALIDSESLSRLPRDMLRVPLLHDVLTEDFVDYYEANDTRLSVDGALRRLAFEHQLDLRDAIVRQVFDEPAHVLFWRTPDGRLGYWLMSMRRNGLAKLMQMLANVATSDTQLSQVTKLGDAPVYALKLATGKTLLFAAKDDRLVVLSTPDMLLDANNQPVPERADAIAKLLAGNASDVARGWQLDLNDDAQHVPKGHRVIVSANYLSFGYQMFFSGIDALRFDLAPGASASAPAADWQTAALIDPGKLPAQWNGAALWRAMPANPAACASLPADWREASGLLGKVSSLGADGAASIGDRLAGPAAVCWYAKSTLVAPVFIARTKDLDAAGVSALKASLGKAFGDMVGAYEAKAAASGAGESNGTSSSDASSGYRRLPVTVSARGADVTLWQRPVSARAGTALARQASFASQLSTARYFPVTLALAHGYVIFSPDARLVDDTLAVLDRRYPALADTLAPDRLPRTILTLTPSSAATLIEREALAALPADQEAIFRNAARTHLLPKLHALATYPSLSLALPANLPASSGWVPVQWWFDRKSAATGPVDAVAAPNAGGDQPGVGGD